MTARRNDEFNEITVLALGIEESGKVHDAIAWLDQVIDETSETLAPSTVFSYENAYGVTHQLFVDLTGTMATSYEAGFPQVVFDEMADLEALRAMLVEGL